MDKDKKKILKEFTTGLLEEGSEVRIIASGYSMYPAISPGNPIILEPVNDRAALKPGDIIAWERDSDMVVHRLVHIYESDGELYYITRGDSTLTSDNPVSFNLIAGRVVFIEKCGKRRTPASLVFIPEWRYRLNKLIVRIKGVIRICFGQTFA